MVRLRTSANRVNRLFKVSRKLQAFCGVNTKTLSCFTQNSFTFFGSSFIGLRTKDSFFCNRASAVGKLIEQFCHWARINLIFTQLIQDGFRFGFCLTTTTVQSRTGFKVTGNTALKIAFIFELTRKRIIAKQWDIFFLQTRTRNLLENPSKIARNHIGSNRHRPPSFGNRIQST